MNNPSTVTSATQSSSQVNKEGISSGVLPPGNSNGVDLPAAPQPQRFKWDQEDDDGSGGYMVGPVPDGEWVRWSDVAHLFGVRVLPAECATPRYCGNGGDCSRALEGEPCGVLGDGKC